MAESTQQREQRHPQYSTDRELLNQLLQQREPRDRHLADLARLRIRYRGFPGAGDIQRDLDRALEQWRMDEEALFTRTRRIHQVGRVYTSQDEGQEDWA
ncbi:MAG: DUF3288 family protein [Oscillatoriales cyanobacterium SM2_2_1]|nr:DUF3288 family protein [Oscillatoriales cyanobacterium SM2_2_1]